MDNEVAAGNLESVRKGVGKKKVTSSGTKGAPKGAKSLKKKLAKRFAK